MPTFTRFVALYWDHINNRIVAGEPCMHWSTAERMIYGSFKKLTIVSVQLTKAQTDGC